MEFIKKIGNIGLILLSGIALGFILIVLTYLLPTNRIRENVEESIYTFYKEKAYYAVVDRYKGTQLDNYTDAIMISNAMYDGTENAINKAVQVYRYINNSGGNPAEQLVEYFTGKDINWNKTTYSRYWHGYLLILKPALLIFNYTDIRMINQIVQTLLIIWIIYLLIKRNLKEEILPFCTAVLSIIPGVIALSLQFSTTVYISLISLLLMLLFHEKLRNKYVYFFLIIGMITSFMDFLTCPILTLGMPMIQLIILNKNNWKKDIKDIIVLSIMWGIGYAGMWISKWIISSILLGENLIIEALNKILERTSDENVHGTFTKKDVLKSNLELIMTIPNILMFIANYIYISYKCIKGKRIWKKNAYLKLIPFIIIAVMPFVWYILASNHSFIHFWFTYRSLAVSIFAILSGSAVVLLNNEVEKEK